MNTDIVDNSIESWSRRAAVMAVDALVDAGLIEKAEFEKAVKVASEEILVRFCMGDHPDLPDGRVD